MSYSEEDGQFVFDDNPAWLAAAHEQLARCYEVKATRTGWDYGSNALFAALDRMGVALDFSALPGNARWFSAGKVALMSDWRYCPTEPYHPNKANYQENGDYSKGDALRLWEVPAAQFRRSVPGSVARGLLRLRHGCWTMTGIGEPDEDSHREVERVAATCGRGVGVLFPSLRFDRCRHWEF